MESMSWSGRWEKGAAFSQIRSQTVKCVSFSDFCLNRDNSAGIFSKKEGNRDVSLKNRSGHEFANRVTTPTNHRQEWPEVALDATMDDVAGNLSKTAVPLRGFRAQRT